MTAPSIGMFFQKNRHWLSVTSTSLPLIQARVRPWNVPGWSNSCVDGLDGECSSCVLIGEQNGSRDDLPIEVDSVSVEEEEFPQGPATRASRPWRWVMLGQLIYLLDNNSAPPDTDQPIYMLPSGV